MKIDHIQICKNIHNNKYDYSLSCYNTVLDKIKIICPEHGIFEQRLSHHKNGSKCPECSKNENKLTIEQFIEKSNNIHNNKYDYSLVVYKNHMSKVKIICTQHGTFEQTPNNHLKGKGCPKCKSNYFISKENFIILSNKKYNNKYDYSLVSFNNVREKIKIICPTHGIFEQAVYAHLHINGCKKCNNVIKNTEDFLKLSEKIHNKKYNYDESVFITMSDKIKIKCHKHGIFYQYPLHHIQGCGCPKCTTRSKGEEIIENFFIDNNINYEIQKKFKKCKFKKLLRFDFYLIDYNLCIEYDGELHFKSVEYFGGDDRLNDNIIKDNIKTNFCKNNNIELLRIKYTDNIIDKLKTFIKI